ncbi:MAG TPA: DUF4265 domain-containing protein [Candidatus Angelobacter sp.]|jgi:hypothetical protein|nr:DUF4265 domain-containing protein [Candidatus Angelobacter sp.]
MESTAGMVKVRLRGPDVEDVETLWATPVDMNLYQLDNSPFFAYGVSWQDVIEAHPAEDQFLEYVRCVTKSGNRTLRVIVQDYRSDDQAAQEVLQGLKSLGCSYEGMQPKMISINVPPKVNLDEVADFLTRQSGLQWEYADPTYDEVTKPVS